MTRGFTLVELVVALVLLEVAVLCSVGTLTVASRMIGDAERLERAVAGAEGVLDSLSGTEGAEGGSAAIEGASFTWTIDDSGTVWLRASGPDGGMLFEVQSAVAVP